MLKGFTHNLVFGGAEICLSKIIHAINQLLLKANLAESLSFGLLWHGLRARTQGNILFYIL